MENIIKVSLNIQLNGSTRVRDDRFEWINWEIKKKDLSNNVKNNEGNKVVKRGRFQHYNYTTKPAVLHTNITLEAYNYMTSNECPSWIHKFKDWKKMTPVQRLESHLNRICQHHNGVSFTYEILED